MPTAHDYRHAARELRALDGRLARDWSVVRVATDVDRVAGGAIGGVVEGGLETVHTELERTRSELHRLAAICERRAEICAAHAAELQRHRTLFTTTGTWTPPPPAPAWWVST